MTLLPCERRLSLESLIVNRMKQAKSASEFIDLSFLSAEEEAAIRQVLLRNEDLTRLESGRVR